MPKEENKKLEYLKREEVRTMAKDIARLREGEVNKESARMAQLRTGEEEKLAGRKEELAKREAEKRRLAEEEAKRKTEEVKILKEEREKREAEIARGETEDQIAGKVAWEEKLKRIQEKEEEERRKFLERVTAESEGAPSPPPSPPSPPPPAPLPPVSAPLPSPQVDLLPKPEAPLKLPKPSFKFPKPKISLRLPKFSLKFPRFPLKPRELPKFSGIFPQKPSLLNKIWVKIIISFLIFAILAAVATFWYWYLVVRETASEEQVLPPVSEKPGATALFINEKIIKFGYYIPSEPRPIDTIIIHSIYDALGDDPHSLEGVIIEYKTYNVAAHYLITREGKIYQTAPREAIAYHAGASQMPDGRTNINNFSIGIELIYTKDESPTEEQYLALAQLVNYLREEYNVPLENILGHRDIAPNRKGDPWNFDWEHFQSLLEETP